MKGKQAENTGKTEVKKASARQQNEIYHLCSDMTRGVVYRNLPELWIHIVIYSFATCG